MCFDMDELYMQGNYETWGVNKYMSSITITATKCHDKPICKSASEIDYYLEDKVILGSFFSKQANLKSYTDPVIISKSDINPVPLAPDQYTFTSQGYKYNQFERSDQWFPWWSETDTFWTHTENVRY